MGYLMERSFAEAMGVIWPRDQAAVVNGRPVTWAEVHAARRKWQAEALRRKRDEQTPRIVPALVWAFFSPHWLSHGWWCYVVTRRESIAVNFRGFATELAASIMRSIPLGTFPQEDFFEDWMVEFAKRYPRKKTPSDRRKAGVKIGWYDRDWRRFALTKATLLKLHGG